MSYGKAIERYSTQKHVAMLGSGYWHTNLERTRVTIPLVRSPHQWIVQTNALTGIIFVEAEAPFCYKMGQKPRVAAQKGGSRSRRA